MEHIEWKDGGLVLLDQRRLPREEVFIRYETVDAVADAITDMVVRGAPAIGVTAAYGAALGAQGLAERRPEDFRKGFEEVLDRLAATRPTAVNLFWAIDRMRRVVLGSLGGGSAAAAKLALETARAIHEDDVERCKAIGRHGAALLPDKGKVLTHCNAGHLATGGYGTAIGVIHAAFDAGKAIEVWVDETRPYLQGARLTAWELQQVGIPSRLITDSMAAHFMARGEVQCVVVGADRIAANGDAANKIGTYGLAVLAKAHGIPFYVAAPCSTVDLACPSGAEIPIEERDASEVTEVRGIPVAPVGQRAANPSFDVTPAAYISAIITERGVARAPFAETLRKQVNEAA